MIARDVSHLPHADVCIVGAGPVGLALALRLEELGHTVLLLEGGPASADTGPVEFSGPHHALPSMATHRGLGGTSALWGGRCVELDDLDFEERHHVPHSGWPIPHSALQVHYRAGLRFLGASDGAPKAVAAYDGEILLNSIERWSRNPVLALLYEERVRQSRLITLARGVNACGVLLDEAGSSVTGLRVSGQEASVTAGSFVLAAGGLETVRLLLSLQKSWSGLVGGRDGPLGRYYQGHLTGYIAVVHLKDPTLIQKLSFQTDGQGGSIRRRLQIHPRLQNSERLLNAVFWLDSISISDPVHGSGSLSLLYLLLRATGLYRRLSRGLAPRSGPKRKGEIWRHLRNIGDHGVTWSQALKMLNNIRRGSRQESVQNPAGRYLLRYHAEQSPNPESRVELRGNVLHVDYRVDECDIESVLRSHELLDRWLRAKGLGQLEYLHEGQERARSIRAQSFDGYHQIGLARMAEDPALGVVDRDCRVHGVANLYVGGASVFPTGGHANPTLPAVALALRLAEHLSGCASRATGRNVEIQV